jgi:hypothetical protein
MARSPRVIPRFPLTRRRWRSGPDDRCCS